MKPKIKVPKNWRKIRKGVLVVYGDKFWTGKAWQVTGFSGIFAVGSKMAGTLIYIRRKPTTRKYK